MQAHKQIVCGFVKLVYTQHIFKDTVGAFFSDIHVNELNKTKSSDKNINIIKPINR